MLLAATFVVGVAHAEPPDGRSVPVNYDEPGAVARGGAKALRAAVRPRKSVTVTSRSVAPGRIEDLRAEARTPEAPATLDLARLDAMPRPEAGGAEWQCLAEAIYHESRGEPLQGQIGVAEVVLNRADDPRFPSSVCGVTKQGVGRGRACQFSYACDGRSDAMTSTTARLRSEKLAALMLAGRPRTVTSGALYFHTRSIRPSWASAMRRTTTIGHHIFYSQSLKVASR